MGFNVYYLGTRFKKWAIFGAYIFTNMQFPCVDVKCWYWKHSNIYSARSMEQI